MEVRFEALGRVRCRSCRALPKGEGCGDGGVDIVFHITFSELLDTLYVHDLRLVHGG